MFLSEFYAIYSGVKTSFAGSICHDLVTCEGTTIISGHFDKKIRFWDTRSLDSPSHEITLQGRICSVDLSPGTLIDSHSQASSNINMNVDYSHNRIPKYYVN